MQLSAAPRRRAVIVGGSLSGLFAGLMLRRLGWQVQIFEQTVGPLGIRGAAVAGHDELQAIYAACGISAPRPPAIDVAGRHAYDRAGQPVHFHPHPQYMTYWRNVYGMLRRHFPDADYHQGLALADLERGDEQSVVVLSDGTRLAADLVIGADGLRSKAREILSPDARPRYAGYFAFRGLVPETQLSETFQRSVFDRYVFIFPRDGQFCGLPLCGPQNEQQAGRRLYTYLWYRRAAGAARTDLLTDMNGVTHEHSVPPPLIRPEHIQRLRQEAADTLPPPFTEAVLRASQHIFQPIYEMESQRVAFGNIALIGDAAFVARPHVGIGVLKAGQDALALTRALAANSDVPGALLAYERERLPVGRNAVRLARYLGQFIEQGHDGPSADPHLMLSPEFIIAASGRPIEQAEPMLGVRKAMIGWQ